MKEKKDRIPCNLQWIFLFPEEVKTPNYAFYFNRAYVLEPVAHDLLKELGRFFPNQLEMIFKPKPAKVDPIGFPTDHRISRCAIYLIYDSSSRDQGAIASLRARRPIDTQMAIAVRKNSRFNALSFLNNFTKQNYALKGTRAADKLPPESFYEPKMFL